MDKRQPTLSFCVHNKNRLWQLRQTMGANLKDNAADADWLEFVFVDFGSTDGTIDWVTSTFTQEIRSGLLKVFSTKAMNPYHIPIAKNTAHRLATGDILVNLDADNFTGPRGGLHVRNQFRKSDAIVFHQWSGDWFDGSYGRISCHRKYFFGIGGYDQDMGAVGFQDQDIIRRLAAMYDLRVVLDRPGFLTRRIRKLLSKPVNASIYNRAVPNTRLDTLSDHADSKFDYDRIERGNRELSDRKLGAGQFVANGGKCGLNEGIEQYLNGTFVPVVPASGSVEDTVSK